MITDMQNSDIHAGQEGYFAVIDVEPVSGFEPPTVRLKGASAGIGMSPVMA